MVRLLGLGFYSYILVNVIFVCKDFGVFGFWFLIFDVWFVFGELELKGFSEMVKFIEVSYKDNICLRMEEGLVYKLGELDFSFFYYREDKIMMWIFWYLGFINLFV